MITKLTNGIVLPILEFFSILVKLTFLRSVHCIYRLFIDFYDFKIFVVLVRCRVGSSIFTIHRIIFVLIWIAVLHIYVLEIY